MCSKKITRNLLIIFGVFICTSYITTHAHARSKSQIQEICKKKNFKKNAITYTFSGGRFGDNLLSYVHAKWVAYKHDLDFLFETFNGSSILGLDFQEKHIRSDGAACFQRSVKISSPQQYNQLGITNVKAKNTLYVLPFFAEFIYEYYPSTRLFTIDWSDQKFKRILSEKILANRTRSLGFDHVPKPADAISVAVHVRRGTGVDSKKIRDGYPLKFPPDSFYIDQLRELMKIFPDKKLYVHIFTDDNSPERIVRDYQTILKSDRLLFNYDKKSGLNPSNKVAMLYDLVKDFFYMTLFDCLIRPNSNFSFIASKVGNYKIVLSPAHYKMVHNHVQVTDVLKEVYE